MNKKELNPQLEKYIASIDSEFHRIGKERVAALEQFGDYIVERYNQKDKLNLVFICTHNSRRSQFGQAWAATASHVNGLDKIITFSGGTESTAFNPRAVTAFNRAGFKVSILDENEVNPEYSLRASEDLIIQPMYSKKFSDPANPSENFTAIMVCSDADEACPFVHGASARFSITYEDPKAFDGTDQEAEKYDERCRQIAREIFYTMDYVRSNL